MAVIGGDDDQGVGVLLGMIERRLDGVLELLDLADLAAGVSAVRLLVDGCALDDQKEARLW